MSRESLGLSENLQKYLLSISSRETDILAELRQETLQRTDSMMQIAPEQGQFMAFLVKVTGANRILEVGTYTGYSALVMAQALPENGRITTLDVEPETSKMAHSYWQRANLSDKIEQVLAPAKESMPKLEPGFDLVFIDADKSNYDFYYEQALRLLKVGGLVLVDNVLWSGRVAESSVQDPDTVALRELNRKVHRDERVDLSLLPIADGLTIARKR